MILLYVISFINYFNAIPLQLPCHIKTEINVYFDFFIKIHPNILFGISVKTVEDLASQQLIEHSHQTIRHITFLDFTHSE